MLVSPFKPGYVGLGEFTEVHKTGKENNLEKLRIQVEQNQGTV